MFEMVLLMASVATQAAVAAAPAPQMPAPTAEIAAAPTPEPDMQILPPVVPASTNPALVAEPQVPTGQFTTALEVRPILNSTRAHWVAIREFGGQDLVYVTHLWAWRCGLLELAVGVNGAAPEPWPLPACHLDQPTPNGVRESDGAPYRAFAAGDVQQLELRITYDDLSTDSVAFPRHAILKP